MWKLLMWGEALTCGSYSHVERALMCGSYSCVEGALMCGSYSCVEGALMCGSYSCVEGALMCQSHSHVKKDAGDYSHVEEVHVWRDIHMCENVHGLFTCVKNMCKTCGKNKYEKTWGEKVCEKHVWKTCEVEETSHQSEILHSLIFFHLILFWKFGYYKSINAFKCFACPRCETPQRLLCILKLYVIYWYVHSPEILVADVSINKKRGITYLWHDP